MHVAKKLSPTIAKSFQDLEKQDFSKSIWQHEIEYILNQAQKPLNDVDLFTLMHKKQHIEMIHAAGLDDNHDLFFDYKNNTIKKWNTFKTCSADIELQKTLGRKMFEGDPNQGDKPLIRATEYSAEVAYEIFRLNIQHGCDFDIFIEDYTLIDYLKSLCDHDGAFALGAYKGDKYVRANRVIGVLNGVLEKPKIDATPSDAQEKSYSEGFFPGSKRMKDDLFYTLTAMPTHQDAKNAGYEYNKLTQIFFEMCDQPDAETEIAQKRLITKFNKAKTLRITNNDGTDVTMDLYDENGPFTFANSMAAKNTPGTEFFSAPAKYSVNGRIVAKGRFLGDLNDYDIIEDITLDFKDGRIVSYDAAKGLETLQKNIEHHENTHYLGEIAFGTNAACREHIANSFMCEKIGGSFHVAIGECFTYTEYCGQPVRLNNGNHVPSGFHWDITTMLHGKEGRIELDGKPVMENGLWIGNEFDVLNRGWEAIPFEQRPPYWQKKFPQLKS